MARLARELHSSWRRFTVPEPPPLVAAELDTDPDREALLLPSLAAPRCRLRSFGREARPVAMTHTRRTIDHVAHRSARSAWLRSCALCASVAEVPQSAFAHRRRIERPPSTSLPRRPPSRFLRGTSTNADECLRGCEARMARMQAVSLTVPTGSRERLSQEPRGSAPDVRQMRRRGRRGWRASSRRTLLPS